MKGINKAIVMGNAGQKPVLSSTKDGKSVVNFSLATGEPYKDKNGNKAERTEWHKIVCFGRLAEIVSEYIDKGDRLYIEGKLRTRKWQDKEGRDCYTTEILADEVVILSERRHHSPPSTPQSTVDDFEDDIPF